jgi:hypothetical protein
MEQLTIRGPEKLVITVSDETWQQISQLRADYTSCIKLAEETDSKKEDAYLRAEAKEALDKLCKLCPHYHTVCLQSEYNSSYTMDCSDSHPEIRQCLCCGTHEYGYGGFKILTTEPFARFEGKYPNQIKEPLSYLLSEATEIAEIQGYRYFGNRR